MHRSGSHDMPLMLPSQALADTTRNTIKESHNAAAQYTTSSEAAQLHPAQSSSKGAWARGTTMDTKNGAQGDRKRHKQ
jgi:hypothetical protein